MTNYRKRLPTAGERITPAAIEAFKAGDKLTLHRELAVMPWQASPLDATTDEPPDWCSPGAYRNSWARARELRLALEAAA